MDTGLKKVKKFLSDGDLVKISIVFKGRQMAHTEFGPKLLKTILEKIGSAQQERDAKFEGRRYVTVIRQGKISESKKVTEDNETENKKSSSQEIQNNSEGQNTQGSSNGGPPQVGKK